MDLRWRLFGHVLVFALALLLAAGAWIGLALREDVAEEMEASVHLVNTMLMLSEASGKTSDELADVLKGDHLRHLVLTLERSKMEQSAVMAAPASSSFWADRLIGNQAVHERRIPLKDGTLVIRANGQSEVAEIVRDGVRILLTLLVFSLAMAVMAWLAAHRALKPVRILEQGLARVGRGEHPVAMPPLALREFASIASCIEQLAENLARARASEQQLARQLLELQEAERRELARELHDEFGQALTAINFAAAFIEKHAPHAPVGDVVNSARDIRIEAGRMLEQVRGLLSRLRPHGLEGLQMVDALNDLVGSWRSRAPDMGFEVYLPRSLPALPPLVSLALYRTVQEALTNVLRHSVASRVRLDLAWGEGALELTVADNGVGRVSEVLHKPRGGLLGMRERAEMAGGRFWLCDTPGGGLELRLSLPVAG
ncbi:MAG: sensor histidine kinase [Zoogloea sp.]|uniref:sensor histidine kinase n=1 Tax=Zoogloea sp. TaxID=49181 RepID=UPI003F2A0EF5